MTPVFANCPLCKYGAFRDGDISTDVYSVKCLRCGPFRLTMESDFFIKNTFSKDNRLIASSKIREFSRLAYVYNQADFEKLSKTSSPSVDDRAINLLNCFSKHYPKIGSGPLMKDMELILAKGLDLDKEDHKNTVAIFVMDSLSRSYCPNEKELDYLFSDYLIDETKFITQDASNKLEITPKGWARLDELKYRQQESNIGFIAMKFLPELIEYSEKWFEGAIKDAGYESKAMYSHKHLKIIDNEMIALIRRSKFLVCDLTNSSRGAYYEAGFAHGLNIPVIFLCEKEFFHKNENELNADKEGVHFDTNHYSIIIWEHGDEKGEELKKELKDWIEATVGRGLLKD